MSSMMATASMDGTVKIWDIFHEGGPKEVGSRHMKQGDLFSMNFCNDIPWVLAAGGNNGEIAVWDTSENEAIETHFKASLPENSYSKADYDPNAKPDDENSDFESISDRPKDKRPKGLRKKKDKPLKK